MNNRFWTFLQTTSRLHPLRLPGLCASCGQWCTSRVCDSCLQRFAAPRPRCQRCAIALSPSEPTVCGACTLKPPEFDACWTAVDYAFPWANLVTGFKFREGLDLCGTLTALMGRRPAPADGQPRVVLPVPLSRQRLRMRGYNQAWELARRVAARRNWPARCDLLIKTHDTPEQMSLSASERALNLRSAFALSEGARDVLRNQRVVLVDDVMTTGATINALTAVLKQGGATSVEAWVFARTPNAANS